MNTKRRAKKMGAALSSLAHSKKLKERERQKEGGATRFVQAAHTQDKRRRRRGKF